MTILRQSVYKKTFTKRRLRNAFLNTVKFLLQIKAQLKYLNLNQSID